MTAMMFRNLLIAMDVEEACGKPIDSVVPNGRLHDKTTPALLMGAASVDLPRDRLSGGPMLNGYFRSERVGWYAYPANLLEAVKAGEMTQDESRPASMSRSWWSATVGHS
jgi:dihydroxyacid dehydratase/phosphogluconate dehydratase